MKRDSQTQRAGLEQKDDSIVKTLAYSHRLTQMLVANLQRALHEADALQGLVVLPLIQRASELRNDLIAIHDAIKEKPIEKP